jgi:hypothetical protein
MPWWYNSTMSVADDIVAKESAIEALRDHRWYRLAKSRKTFVEREKENAAGKPYEADLKAVIEQGYLSLLDCILETANRDE